jgi:hypothetical protein
MFVRGRKRARSGNWAQLADGLQDAREGALLCVARNREPIDELINADAWPRVKVWR